MRAHKGIGDIRAKQIRDMKQWWRSERKERAMEAKIGLERERSCSHRIPAKIIE